MYRWIQEKKVYKITRKITLCVLQPRSELGVSICSNQQINHTWWVDTTQRVAISGSRCEISKFYIVMKQYRAPLKVIFHYRREYSNERSSLTYLECMVRVFLWLATTVVIQKRLHKLSEKCGFGFQHQTMLQKESRMIRILFSLH